MDHLAIAGHDLHRADVHVVSDEWQLHIRILPGVLALSFYFHRGRRDDDIRWSPTGMIPSLRKLRGRGCRFAAALGASIHPRYDLVDFRLTEAAIVAPLAMLALGVPRRHLARDDFGLDRADPGPHFLVRHERHGRHLARPVALRALLVQDRSNLFPE